MDVLKFWRLAEKYPWLPRVTHPWDSNGFNGDSHGPLDPNQITLAFGLKAIRKEFGSISVLNMSELDMGARSDDFEQIVQRGTHQEGTSELSSKETSTTYYCYWHKRAGDGPQQYVSRPFACFTSIGNNTVGKMISEVEKEKGIIDAIVEVHLRHSNYRAPSAGPQGSPKAPEDYLVGNNSCAVWSYKIYLRNP